MFHVGLEMSFNSSKAPGITAGADSHIVSLISANLFALRTISMDGSYLVYSSRYVIPLHIIWDCPPPPPAA